MIPKPTPTLYEWMGGDPETFVALIENFYDRVIEDPLLKSLFEHMRPEHRRRVAAWFTEVFGGPAMYSDAQGNHAGMVKRHLNLAITEAQQKRWVQLMNDAADATQLPKDPEFRSAFLAYVEWGTRMALMYSQPGMEPPSDQAPMPKWGWGEAKPYIPD